MICANFTSKWNARQPFCHRQVPRFLTYFADVPGLHPLNHSPVPVPVPVRNPTCVPAGFGDNTAGANTHGSASKPIAGLNQMCEAGPRLGRDMDLVPEQPSASGEKEGPPPAPPPSPSLLSQPPIQCINGTQLPPQPLAVVAEDPPPTTTTPTSTLMGPAQPGALIPWENSLPPPETFPIPTAGPLAATSSLSNFSAFAPSKADEHDPKLLACLTDGEIIYIENCLDSLRAESNKILAGVTNYYNTANLTPVDGPDRDDICHEPEALNSAFRLAMYALDTGFPSPTLEVQFPPVFEGNTWVRVACATLAAIRRGMIRSTPACLKAATSIPLNLSTAILKLHQDIIPPKTEGELLQCLTEQIGGMVNFHNDLNLDANPYTFFDGIKEKTRVHLEEGARLQARIEVDEWRNQFVNRLKATEFKEIAKSLASELSANPLHTDIHKAYTKQVLTQMVALRNKAIAEAKEAIKDELTNDIKLAVEAERANMHKKETEHVQREVSQDVSQEAARDLGLTPSDFATAPGGKDPSPRNAHLKPGVSPMGPPPPRTGAKRTASAPLEIAYPSPRRIVPLVPPTSGFSHAGPQPPPNCPRTPSPGDNGGLAGSMHNPNNVMEVDNGPLHADAAPQNQGHPTPLPLSTQANPKASRLEAIQNMLASLAARIEQVADMVEKPQNRSASERTPAADNRPTQQPTRVDIPRPANTNDGFIQTEPPRRTWNVITANGIAQQTNANAYATRAAANQGRTPTGRPTARASAAQAKGPSNTEVTVLRDGGLLTQAAEAAVRAQRPDTIVKEVQRQINAKIKNNPIQLLAGRWSSSVRRTGNFIFTIRGRVDFSLIASYSRFLLAPFLDAQLAPTGTWTWAQLRGVPIWNEVGTPQSQEELLNVLRANLAFETAILTIAPRWQVPIERLTGDTGTILISYCDADGAITRQAREDHVFMFNSYAMRTTPVFAESQQMHSSATSAEGHTIPKNTTKNAAEFIGTLAYATAHLNVYSVGTQATTRGIQNAPNERSRQGQASPTPSPASQGHPFDDSTSEAQVEWDLDWERLGEEPVPGGWDNTKEETTGHGPSYGIAPRNATPGPSHV
ncbi:hypothetical protein EI94DRAFT_1871349 [Lactarius quietus]|nr:hypothetical protein EI94DRAFT_1871349 [Lactarius quietus]